MVDGQLLFLTLQYILDILPRGEIYLPEDGLTSPLILAAILSPHNFFTINVTTV